MEKRSKTLITFLFAVFLIASLYIFSDWFSRITGYALEDDYDKDLAKCLASKGTVLYGSKKCPDCEKQRDLLGEKAFSLVKYVDCSVEPVECKDIEGIPAWKINDVIRYGPKTLDQLRTISLCS